MFHDPDLLLLLACCAAPCDGRRPGGPSTTSSPLSALFTIATAALIGFRFGQGWLHYVAVLLTCAVLVLLPGLNVAIIGLVDVPSSAAYLIAEMFALIVALNLVFLGGFLVLERRRFFAKPLIHA